MERIPMEEMAWHVRFSTATRLGDRLCDAVGELTVHHHAAGGSTAELVLPDLPAVYGLILQLRDMALPLEELHIERRNGDE